MPKAVSWKPEYSVGIPELDTQHQSLFRLVQGLRDAIASGQGRMVIGTALQNLVHYTMHHFATEEELMQQHGFPGTTAHRIEHNALTVKLSELQEKHREGDPDCAEKCLRFLEAWLEDHVLEVDRQYMPFLSAKSEPADA